MKKIDTSEWKDFVIKDLFERLKLKVKKENFNKRTDTSTGRTDVFTLPLVNAKDGNNGIMFYGKEEDFEYAEMCLDIVQNGAVATGNVYPQIEKTGVLWDAYLIKPKFEVTEYSLIFLARIMQSVLKQKYNYDNKAIWDKVKNDHILLPVKEDGQPDCEYMEKYICSIVERLTANLQQLLEL